MRKWILGILLGSLTMVSVPIMAQSETIFKSDILQVKVSADGQNGTEWRSPLEAPKLRIVIKDGYKNLGQKEAIHIMLENAYWVNNERTDLTPTYMERIREDDIEFSARTKNEIECSVQIPTDIKEGQDIVIEFPLLIRVRDEAVSVSVSQGYRGNLIDSKKILIAAGMDKRVTYTIEEVPKIIEKGCIAPIRLDELQKGRLGGEEIELSDEIREKAKRCIDTMLTLGQ